MRSECVDLGAMLSPRGVDRPTTIPRRLELIERLGTLHPVRSSVLAGLVLSLGACAGRPSTVPPAPVVVAPRPVAATEAPALTEASAEPPEDEDFLLPCAEGTPELQAATQELASLSQAIQALPPGGDPKPIGERLAALVESKCFAGAGSESVLTLGAFGSALSLKTYWFDGGEAALSSRLEWNRPPTRDRRYWVGPSIRTALTLEDAGPRHPLGSLLCSASPGTPVTGVTASGCGSETAGWMLRAKHALRAHARAELATAFLRDPPPGDPPKTHASCIQKATRSAAASKALAAFGECLHEVAVREDALPLGTFRAPRSGWLVLRGRRGHHGYCNELRAYDLATGAVWMASLCGGLSAPSGAPSITVQQGRVAVESLREAALVMFLAGSADRSVLVSGEGHAIPPELTIHVPKNRGIGLFFGSIGFSSGRTTLVFQWVQQGKSLASGTVSWPDAHAAIDEHATTLLAIAEASFVKGCAPAPLPIIPWAARNDTSSRVSSRGAYFPEYDGPEFDDLERELTRVASSRAPCKP